MEENVPERTAESAVVQTEQKKKTPVLTIIFAILALAGIGFGVYGMFFSKPAEKECANSEVANESNEIYTEDENKNNEAIEDANDENKGEYAAYYQLISPYMKRGLFYAPTFDTVGFNDINYMSVVAADYKWHGSGNVLKQEYDDTMLELFGYDSSSVKSFHFKCQVYNLDGDRYVIESGGNCGGASASESTIKIRNIEENDDKLIIDVTHAYIVYSMVVPSDVTLHKDSNIEEYIKKFNDNEEDTDTKIDQAKQYFKEHLDEFRTYRLTFKKADKHYYLESGEKID